MKYINLDAIIFIEGNESRVEVWFTGREDTLILFGSEVTNLLKAIEGEWNNPDFNFADITDHEELNFEDM